MTFLSGGKVEITFAGMTKEGTFLVEDNKVKVTAGGDTQIFTIEDNGCLAGGGPIGGKGTDVATVQTEGLDFPFPGYLNNIVRQIALRFNPSDANSGLRAEVRFVIRRDGSVIGIGFVTRSGNYAFDLEAHGAVEAAASQFGALPEGFRDDALPVVFSFDPRIIR